MLTRYVILVTAYMEKQPKVRTQTEAYYHLEGVASLCCSVENHRNSALDPKPHTYVWPDEDKGKEG